MATTYTTVYLEYDEYRTSDGTHLEDVDIDFDDDLDEIQYGEEDTRTFVEFTPTKLRVKEPLGDNVIELDLDTPAKIGDTLYVLVVRYNNYREGVLEEWCVERVFKEEEAAEELVESLEDGLQASECADSRAKDTVVVRSEVVKLKLKK